MRQALFVLVLAISLFFPVAVRAQGPMPPPSLAETCVPEGKFHPVECFRAAWNAMGVWGVIGLGLFVLVVYLFASPTGKAVQTWVGENVGEWLRLLFAKPTPPAEIQRREAEYLLYLSQSETLRDPAEIASHFDAYLHALQDHENPLKPSEDRFFVDLESGLDTRKGSAIQPRIGLAIKVQSEQTRSFVEQKTFPDLAEAVDCVDEQTGHPYPALALLGEPGAGKSTLLRKLARQKVQERIQDSSNHLPIFVSLSAHRSGRPLAFLRQHWKNMLGFDGLDDYLAKGRLWLFLDGLNEMERAGYHDRVRDWRVFLGEHCLPNGNRALIACRVADYGMGVDVPRLLIHAMDEERIREFLKKRNPDHAEILWKALENDRDEGRGAMYELAQIPFWLVMIARLSGKEGLPRNRADLIGQFVSKWLDYESSRPGGRDLGEEHCQAFLAGMTQLGWTGLSRGQNPTFRVKETRKLLTRAQAGLAADTLLELAQDCSLFAIESNGLLPPASDSPRFQDADKLRFHHQLLQEYFAAREFAPRFWRGKNLAKLWKVPWKKWEFVESKWDPLPPPPNTDWVEAVILAAGMLPFEQAERLTLAVLPNNPPLAARCILESGVEIGEAVIEKVKQRLQADLENQRVRLPARLAAGKALAKLGDPRLIKRRGEVELPEGKKIAFIAPDWVHVPAGSSQMGTTPAQRVLLLLQRANPNPDEMRPHIVSLSAFKIARHPVTIAEYRCFMDAGGYQNDDYWKEENSLRWRNAPLPFEESYYYLYIRPLREKKEHVIKQVNIWVRQGSWSPSQAESLLDDLSKEDEELRKQWEGFENAKRDPSGQVTHPWLWDNQQFTVANQPVIGVSWYEACAYAAWLTEVLQKQKLISDKEEIRLPTEAEWEKAARGTKGRLWSWGNLWRSSYANTLEGRVMQPSSIGAYPKNRSPYGLEDMIGNVWEWCLDWYDENEYRNRKDGVLNPRGPENGSARVLRGGSGRRSERRPLFVSRRARSRLLRLLPRFSGGLLPIIPHL